MIDTTDLTSYISGYDDYCEPKETIEKYENPDLYHDDILLRREYEKMQRNIIDLNNTNMTFSEIMKLEDYVWKNNKLIPAEMLEGE